MAKKKSTTTKRRYTRKPKELSFDAGVVGWRNLFPDCANDYEVTDKRGALSIGSVYRAVDLIASTVGRTDCHIYRDGANNSRAKATNHPAYRLLFQNANSITTAGTFLENLVSSALLHGNGFAYIARNDLGEPEQLINLDSQHVSIVVIYHDSLMPEITYTVTGVGTQGSTQQFYLRPDEIIHLKSLGNSWCGFGLLDVARECLGLSRKSANFAQAYIDNSGVLQTVFNMGAFKDEAQKKEFYEQFQRRTGVKNAFTPIFMPTGWTVTTLPVNADQLALDQLSDRLDRAVANFTGLPPHKLAVPGIGSSYGSIDAENQSSLGDVYDKWYTRLETELTLKLCTEAEKASGKVKVEFDRSTLLASDPVSHEQRLINLWTNNLISREEARLEMNRSTVIEGTFFEDMTHEQTNDLHTEPTIVQPTEQPAND